MKLPRVAVRTDEGTPIGLADLEGRAMALFLLGGPLDARGERILALIEENIDELFGLEVSPIAVIADTVEGLASFRQGYDVPFLLLADADRALHEAFREEDGAGVDVWIADAGGVVVEMIPTLAPAELVRLAIEACARA
jgi:peroxiredoxin